MDSRIKRILLTENQIIDISKNIAKQINDKFANKFPVMIGLLNGCVPFFAELIKHITIDIETQFMVVSSYHGGVKSSGEVKIVMDIDTLIDGRDVIIIEDIIDSGRTLSKVKSIFEARGAKVTVVSLLDKKEGRVVEFEADIVGYNIPNEFVVGFGLDYAEKFRNLPYIGILKEEVYKGE